jgi:hypothetical protein
MAASGLLLWANNWSLRYLPKAMLDVATAVHYYEAVLAAAAILIWHFYFVLFDPEVYPMDSAWLTGVSVRRRKRMQQNMEDGDRNIESVPVKHVSKIARAAMRDFEKGSMT